jgi:hypothetical protein
MAVVRPVEFGVSLAPNFFSYYCVLPKASRRTVHVPPDILHINCCSDLFRMSRYTFCPLNNPQNIFRATYFKHSKIR